MSAVLSLDSAYRYRLDRVCGNPIDHWRGRVLWVMLNPSTADSFVNDATIRKCMAFTARWGYAGMTVVNAFGLRSRDPKLLMAHPDPVGPENDAHIRMVLRSHPSMDEMPLTLIIAAWGVSYPKAAQSRIDSLATVLRTDERTHHLGLTKSGQPRHPLFLSNDVTPVRWAA